MDATRLAAMSRRRFCASMLKIGDCRVMSGKYCVG